LGGYGGYGNWGYPSNYGYGGWGYGPSSWLYGGSLYGYGYSPYANPYDSYSPYASSGVVGAPFDYSQPINTVSAPPAQSVVDEAAALFGSARNSFKEGNFALALQQADAALARNPNDSSLHEFRALCLFALGRYDEAATALYAVLSVGPGWDWPTLIGLYPNINVYTAQFRALEDSCQANPQSSSSRFVLAYHYLTQGHFDAAATTLKQVVALKPNDTLAAKLLELLQSPRQTSTDPGAQPPAPAPDSVPVNAAPPEGATISGTWTAQPNPDTSVALTIQPDGAFHWEVNQKGQTRQFSGTSNFGGGLLTLVTDKSPPIVGRVSWTDPRHMTFRVIGDSPNAPGLSFSK
jgi:tetratricopeptide (TPR) repeat protein